MSGFPQLHSITQQNRMESAFHAMCAEGATRRASREAMEKRTEFYSRFGKRIFDTLVAAAAVVMTGPFLGLCALAVRLESRGPVFFRQWRVGLNGKPFQVIKLRTMIHGAQEQGPKITASGDPRITRVGRFLRRSKMDELPQFFNVLRNEMSLVGPRPEVPEYTLKYSLAERKVLQVKPGITGPASLAHIDEEQLLAGRTDREHFYVSTIMRHKLQIDLAYCRRLSFFEDLKYIFLTVGALLVPRDLGSKNLATSLLIGKTKGSGTSV